MTCDHKWEKYRLSRTCVCTVPGCGAFCRRDKKGKIDYYITPAALIKPKAEVVPRKSA